MESKAHSENPAGALKTRSRKGLWFYLCIVMAMIGLSSAMAFPNIFGGGRKCKEECINNLRQLDGAKEQWALENKKSAGTIVTAADEKEILAYLKGGKMPKCPKGGTLRFNNVEAAPTCTVKKHTLK